MLMKVSSAVFPIHTLHRSSIFKIEEVYNICRSCLLERGWPQFYGTTLEEFGYYMKNNPVALVFGRSVGPSCYDSWKINLQACTPIDGVYIPEGTTIVDQERDIYKAFREVMAQANIFMNPLHVQKNL